MLNIYMSNLSIFIIKLFKMLNLSFYYIKYLFICMKYLNYILQTLNKLNRLTFYTTYNKLTSFVFKKIFINKNTYYKAFIAKSLKELRCFGVVITSPSINTYLIQKNFSFYYTAFILKLKIFTILLNYRKLLFVMFSFKLILFNLYFYNIRVLV